MNDLQLNNGTVAAFKGFDDWSRPYYDIKLSTGKIARVCCVNLDGTYLHTYTNGEPDTPLKRDYQPVQINN